MCGNSCGIVDLNTRDVRTDALSRMCSRMVHRGPDDMGMVVLRGQHYRELREADELSPVEDGFEVGFGHRRLSIIDLSEIAHQPMSNEDGTIWIVFNGEIYNFQEIKPELEARGHLFRSKSDTEVILHAYEEWGIDCLKRFRGMFAFAIWDSTRRRLFHGPGPTGEETPGLLNQERVFCLCV